MTQTTGMQKTPETNLATPSGATEFPPRTSPLPPFFVLICLVFAGCAWIYFSQLYEFVQSGMGKPAGFQWGSDMISLAKFIGSQAVFFLLILSSLAPTFYRSSVFAGCGISMSLSYVAWLAFFKSSEQFVWWNQFQHQEYTAAVCLLATGAFFFIRWLALPAPNNGESPFLGGLLVLAIPSVIIGPLVLILFSHHHWLVFLRGQPLISIGLLGPMVGSAIEHFAFLSFFLFFMPILSGFLAQLRWGNNTPEESTEVPATDGAHTRGNLFYRGSLLTIFMLKIVLLAVLSSSIDSLHAISLAHGLVFRLPISMVMFALITPLFLVEWLLLFSWNDFLRAKTPNHSVSASEKIAVFVNTLACLIQTGIIFFHHQDHGLEVFYLVSLTMALLMSGYVGYRRVHQDPKPDSDFSWHATLGAYWEMSLFSGFLLLWFSSSIVYLALAIGLDFVPLSPQLAGCSVTGLAETMADNLIPMFPPLIFGFSLIVVILWGGIQSLLVSGIQRLGN